MHKVFVFRREKMARKVCSFIWRLYADGWNGRAFGKGGEKEGRRRGVFVWFLMLSMVPIDDLCVSRSDKTFFYRCRKSHLRIMHA